MDKSVITSVIFDQQHLGLPVNHVPRVYGNLLNESEITVISGVRRCGKSTLLHEIRSNFEQNNYYLNFDDERLIHFSVDDFQSLYELFIEHFGKQSNFFFDEIQNIKGWERFVRRLYDYGNKIYITGSNASMLSRELGTHLTGRYFQHELYPFSFFEYCRFKKVTINRNAVFSTEGKSRMKQLFNQYFQQGGFPAYLQSGNKQYLKSLYESILYRDIIVRNGLTNERELLELIHFLASNVSRPASYNSLSKVIDVKNATTVKNYLEYIQNTYLLFLVNKFDYSLKGQIQNPKKVFFIDLALIRELGFLNSEDNGRLLENLVFLELKRRGKEVFYHRQKHECDFVIHEKNKIIEAIQVSWSLYRTETRNREIPGLVEAMKLYNLPEGLILTESEEETIEMDKHKIVIKPTWKWLLEVYI